MTDYSLIQSNSWIETGKNKTKYDYIAGRVYKSAEDLVKKKLIPKYAIIYLTDPKMLKAAIEECFRYKFQEWTCPDCQIRVFGPKAWISFHLAIHGRFDKREQRGGETYQMKFHLD